MGRSMKWVVCLVVLVLISNRGNADISCSDALTNLFPCEDFLLGFAIGPGAQCCAGVQILDKVANASQPDRRAICQCFKTAAQSYPINQGNAKQIPALCKLTTTVVIEPNIDCTRI